MNVKWDYQLKDWQKSNPVMQVYRDIPGVTFQFNEAEVREVLTSKGHQLKTWGGSESTSEPHWIGVTKQTPLHTDPRYPRYTWHLLVKVDNFVLRGMDKEECVLKDNMIILLDTHSPHQLFAKDKLAVYYLAVSIDSKTILPFDEVKDQLIHYANTQPVNINKGRITK
jgi:hypothetical protein